MSSQPEPQSHGPAGQTPWYQVIRDIHDRHFHDNWQDRVDVINERLALSGPHQLFTPGPGAPMPWFNGNIEVVEPGRWVLVISLNHYVNPDARIAPDRAISPSYTAQTYWDHRRTFNTTHWYGKFFGPLARVAAAALGEPLPKEQEPVFATNRMIFVEICPYGSQKFNLSWETVEELLRKDSGFQRAADVNHVLIAEGRPALVMVNGVGSINMLAHLHSDALSWRQLRYASCDPPGKGGKVKWLRHYCGSLNLGYSTVPVVGFPFLKTAKTHNSNAELALLANHVRQCVEGLDCVIAP